MGSFSSPNKTGESTFNFITSVQDGVGSFGRNTSETNSYFKAFEQKLSTVVPPVELWATIETFLPDAKVTMSVSLLIQICEPAPDSRIAEQVLAVQNSVNRCANFWSYNLPNAPECPF